MPNHPHAGIFWVGHGLTEYQMSKLMEALTVTNVSKTVPGIREMDTITAEQLRHYDAGLLSRPADGTAR